jgi:hypothetical protein
MRSYTVFQFTQRTIENRSTCHASRRLPTPDILHFNSLSIPLKIVPCATLCTRAVGC